MAEQFFAERTKAVRGFTFSVPIQPNEKKITYAEAITAFNELREQAKDVPEMSIDEINAEISIVRAEKRARNAFKSDSAEVAFEKQNQDAYLVTGNQKHYPIRKFIVSPAEMLEIMKNITEVR